MVQIKVAHQGREYDIELHARGQLSAADIKQAVAEELNLSPDNFRLKHGDSDFNEDLAQKLSNNLDEQVLSVYDLTQGGLQEVLISDEIPYSLMIEHLSGENMKQTEESLVSFYGKYGAISRLFLQQDETWQHMWCIITFAQGTNMESVPTNRPPIFAEQCTVRPLTDIGRGQYGAVHVLGFLGDLFRRGRAEGQLGMAIMRTFEDFPHLTKGRFCIRVIEEHAPLEALRAWVVRKEDDVFSAFASAEMHQAGAERPLHPAFVWSKAKVGQIVHSAAKDASAFTRVPARERPGHTPGCACGSCRCGMRCSCDQCENLSTTTQSDEDSSGNQNPTGMNENTIETGLRHTSGCTCKDCQCGRECSCDNCAHWSR